MVPEFGDVTHQISTPGKSGSARIVLSAAAILAVITLITAGFGAALVVAVIVLIIGAVILIKLGLPFLDQPTTYTNQTTNEKLRDYRCCIQCRTPVEILL